VPKEKRPRKDASPSITEILPEDFLVYSKRPKTTHSTHGSWEEETRSTKVANAKITPLPSSGHQMISTSS
jgi:hypothetical protein